MIGLLLVIHEDDDTNLHVSSDVLPMQMFLSYRVTESVRDNANETNLGRYNVLLQRLPPTAVDSTL